MSVHCLKVFPNVFFSIYPHHIFQVIIDPVSATESRECAPGHIPLFFF